MQKTVLIIIGGLAALLALPSLLSAIDPLLAALFITILIGLIALRFAWKIAGFILRILLTGGIALVAIALLVILSVR